MTFFVPLTEPVLPGSTRAVVRGFGSVFTDVDLLHDIVVADDFIYGEPVAVPEPASGALLLAGSGWLLWRKRRAARRPACPPASRR